MLTAGFGTSLLIEVVQLITCKGIFDVDDLFANTLGTMLGWGVLMAVLTLGNRKEGWKKRSAAYLSVPILFSLVMAFIWIGYTVQPYGNLPNAPVVTGNLKDVQWKLAFSPETSPSTAQVYQVGRLDKTASEAFGAEFAEKLGITFEDVYYYDDTIIFANHFSGDFLNLNQRDGSWEYRIGRDLRPVFDKSPADISSEEIRAILLEWGISVPQDASFSMESSESGFSQASFTAELVSTEGKLFHGTLTCDFQQEEDGALKMVSVDNRMVVFSPCKEEPILTPEQAVEALYNGRSFEGYLLERNGITQIRILSCALDWMADTKGFYQPVYRFTLQISDQDTVTDYVVALK